MKKWILSFLMVIGIQISSFSQSSYPRIILWENDTVLAITRPQLVTINRSLNDYVHLKKINENLQMDLCISDSIISYWKKYSVKSDSISMLNYRQLINAENINKSMAVFYNNEKKKSRRNCIGVGVGGTLLGIVLGVLLIK